MVKRIRVPGLNGRGIPDGYILGRLKGAKHGDVQLLDLNSLRQFGVASANATKKDQSLSGFTFSEGGRMLTNELLGSGSWPHDVTFTNDQAGTLVQCDPGFTATSTNPINIHALISGVDTLVGTITPAVGVLAAAVSWLTSPYVHLAGNALSLRAPSPADATWGNVHGTVTGYRS